MKSIVVRAAVTGFRLPILVAAFLASPLLRALAFFVALPVLAASSLLGLLLSIRRVLLGGAWFLVRRAVLAWLGPWIFAVRLLWLPFRVLGWLARRLVG